MSHLPQVRRAAVGVEPIGDLLGQDGGPTKASLASGLAVATVGSVNGLYFNQDRVTVIRGRISGRTGGCARLSVANAVPQCAAKRDQAGFTPSKSPWWSGQETSPPSVEPVREPVIADGAQARDVVVDVMHIQGD